MVAPAKRMLQLKQLYAIRFGEGAAILPKDISRIHLDFAYRINGGHRGPRKFWRRYLPPLKYHNPAVQMTVNRTIDQTAPAILSIFYAKLPGSISPASSSSSSSSPSRTADTSSTNPSSSSTDTSSSTTNKPSEHLTQSSEPEKSEPSPSHPAPISTTTSPLTSSSTARPIPTSTNYAPTDRVLTIDMKHRKEADILEEFMRLTSAELVRPTEEDEIERLEIEAETEKRRLNTEALAKARAHELAEKEALAQARARLA